MIDRLFLLPERRAGLLIAAIGLLFALAYGSSLLLRPKPSGRIVLGDATHHYVQLRSAVFDRDLHFQNEYFRLYGFTGGEPDTYWITEETTATGHVRNLMPVGPAIVWLPLYLLVIAGVAVANLFGAGYPLDGYGRIFQASAGLSGVAAAAVGVWLVWRMSRRLFGARAAAWGCLLTWFCSPAIYYSVISPTYSHATSLLVVGGFWLAWVHTREAADVRRYATLGTLAGAASLMRWQDAVLLAPLALELLIAVWTRRVRPGRGLLLLLLAGGSAALAFAPQMAVWWVLYGQPLAIPQGPEFMRWSAPALVQVLLSDNHGLLTWTPIVALSLAGLLLLRKRDPNLALAAGTFFVISWYVNAAVADWWAGEAFGARRFVSCVPIFALGLAALIDAWAPPLRRLAVAGSLITVHTLLLLLQYQLFMHGWRELVPYPRGAYALWLARFVVPIDLAREWVLR